MSTIKREVSDADQMRFPQYLSQAQLKLYFMPYEATNGAIGLDYVFRCHTHPSCRGCRFRDMFPFWLFSM